MSEIIEKLKAKHDSIQNTEHPNMITIRDGIEIKIHLKVDSLLNFFRLGVLKWLKKWICSLNMLKDGNAF